MRRSCPRCHGFAARINEKELEERAAKAVKSVNEKGAEELGWLCKSCVHSFWRTLHAHCPLCGEPAVQVTLLKRSQRSKIKP